MPMDSEAHCHYSIVKEPCYLVSPYTSLYHILRKCQPAAETEAKVLYDWKKQKPAVLFIRKRRGDPAQGTPEEWRLYFGLSTQYFSGRILLWLVLFKPHQGFLKGEGGFLKEPLDKAGGLWYSRGESGSI